jgi:hypothetical protein
MRQGSGDGPTNPIPLAVQQFPPDGRPDRGKILAPGTFLGFNLNKMG